jgi:hypothetical protein
LRSQPLTSALIHCHVRQRSGLAKALSSLSDYFAIM